MQGCVLPAVHSGNCFAVISPSGVELMMLVLFNLVIHLTLAD